MYMTSKEKLYFMKKLNNEHIFIQFEIKIIFQNKTHNLVEYVHFEKINLVIHDKLTQKSDVLKKIYVFLVTYCKRFHPKSPFYEKVKRTTKRTTILESFVTVGSFNCDHTQMFFYNLKPMKTFSNLQFLKP